MRNLLFLFIVSLLSLTGCQTVSGERMVRIVELDASSSALPLTDVTAGGIRVETSGKPLTGKVTIKYTGLKATVDYESGGNE
jgi:hypothetical protein